MVSSAYQYYLTNYAYKQVTSYDTHKKSELRQIYSNIVKLNKKSPLYKFKATDEVQRFAIDIKESARSFRNIVLDATNEVESGNLLARKTPFSSDDELVSVSYIGENAAMEEEGTAYEIEIRQLAKPQVNMGDFLPSNRLDFNTGSHSFDLTIGGNTYEFQFKISDSSTNLKVQEKLSRLINRSNVGLRADVLKDQNGSSALQITTLQTGTLDENHSVFHFSDNTSSESNCVDLLGLNRIAQHASNATYFVDGKEQSSPTNLVTVGKAYELTLKDLTEGPIEIGMHKSTDALVKHMQSLADGFNSLYDISSGQDFISDRLHKDLNSITKRFRNTLDTTGLVVQKDGHIKTDESLIIQSALDGTLDSQLDQLSNFRGALMRQINQISLDPLEYIKRTMISYPNFKHNYANAYQASVYSGMMFNGYV